MPKFQFLVHPRPDEPATGFRAQIMEQLGPRLLAADPLGLKLTLADPEPPRFSVIPFQRRALALVSVWTRAESQAGQEWLDLVRRAGHPTSGYRVAQSTPVAYQPDWPAGTATPGAGLLTLLKRKRGLSDHLFMERWHQGHSSISLDIHPLWNYVRNVVEAPLAEGSDPWDGIVEEHFRLRRALLDPRVFFGGSLRMVPNMLRVAVDISRFLDLRSLQSYLVDEFILKPVS